MKFRFSDLNSDTIKKGLEHIRTTALPEALSKARSMVTGTDLAYDRFFREHLEADEEELARQRQVEFAYAPCISIVVPVYMTPELSLRSMIESVLHQTYANWELCLVDGSQAEGELPVLDAYVTEDGVRPVLDVVYSLETERVIRHYMQEEPRIRYKKMQENRGISGNTNCGLEMAHGEYVALLDHDDVLTEDALFQIVEALQTTRYDLLYSDEDRMSENGAHYLEPRFKPDLDFDLLRACNYIQHLLVAKRTLLLRDGGFHSVYDGAQDYDMIFRCCEASKQVCHIAKVLYHKRIHEGNAQNRQAKHAQENLAGKEVLAAHLSRERLLARAMTTEKRNVYVVRYDTPGNPLVSIVISGHTNRALMERMLEPFYEKTRYSNFEIIIVDSDIADVELQKYYQRMQARRRNIVVVPATKGKSRSEHYNIGSLKAKGDYLLFLDANMEIANPFSIGEMLGLVMRKDVGVAAGTVYDDRERLYCTGVEFCGDKINRIRQWQSTVAKQLDFKEYYSLYRYVYRGMTKPEETQETHVMRRDESGAMQYFDRNRQYMAVPSVCMMVKKSVFVQAGGFLEKFKTELAAYDFCMRVRERGYVIVNAARAGWYYHDLPELVRQAREKEISEFQTIHTERELFETLWSRVLDLG